MNKDSFLRPLVLPALVIGLAACANPADNKPEAKVSDTEAPAADAEEPGTGVPYVFNGESAIGFTGSKVTGSHDGGFESFDGGITLVAGDPARSQITVNIDATSLWADDERLAGHLKSPDFFDVETYPTARFRSTSISLTPTGFDVTGELNLHGVTKRITFPASITVSEERVTADAEFVIQRFHFGIEYPGRADDLIRDEVVLRLHLVAVPEGPAAAS